MSLRTNRTSIAKADSPLRVIVRREIVLVAEIVADAAVDVTAAALAEDADVVDAADVPVAADAVGREVDGTSFFATDSHGYARI